jgi:thiamine biosynthesis lipoprotein
MFEAWEAALSRFRPESELCALNRQTGCPVEVGPVLWEVLSEALAAAHLTDGLVTPTMLAALERAGYDASFEVLAGRKATAVRPHRIEVGLSQADWRSIRLDRRGRTVTLPPGMRIDLGGIVKGWASDKAARWLGAVAPAMLDAGGDIGFSGPRRDGSAWPIAVDDPHAPDTQLALLALPGGGVATSGRDYRRWRVGAKWQHHIIDPRTGQPAGTDVISATVVAPSTMQAEVGAKAALILGSRDGLAWIEARPPLAAIITLEDRRVMYSNRMKYHIWG